MRILLLLLLITPTLVHAIGAESCHLEGKINGKPIAIEFTTGQNGENAYGNPKTKTYGYCAFSTPVGDEAYPRLLTCYETQNGKPSASYELRERQSKSGIFSYFYNCKTGCKANVAKKLFYVCEDGC